MGDGLKGGEGGRGIRRGFGGDGEPAGAAETHGRSGLGWVFDSWWCGEWVVFSRWWKGGLTEAG